MQDWLNIVGIVNYTRGIGKISSMRPMSAPAAEPQSFDPDVVIEAFDATGQSIGKYAAQVKVAACPTPDEDVTGIVNAYVPMARNAERVELLLREKLLDSRTSTALEGIRGFKVNNPLRYTVQVSADDGNTWDTIAVDEPTPNYNIRPGDYPATTTPRVRVIESDGFRSRIREKVLDKPLVVHNDYDPSDFEPSES